MPLAFDAKFRSLPRPSGKKAPWMSYRPASATPQETPKLQDKMAVQAEVAPVSETIPIRKKSTELAPTELSQIAKGLGQKNYGISDSSRTVANGQKEETKQNKSSTQSMCGSDSTVQGESPDVSYPIKSETFHQAKEEAVTNFALLISSYEEQIANLKSRIAESAQTITRQIKIIQDQISKCQKFDELRALLAHETARRQYVERLLARLEDDREMEHSCKETQNQPEQITGKRTHSGNYAATRKRILEAENLTSREREFLTGLI